MRQWAYVWSLLLITAQAKVNTARWEIGFWLMSRGVAVMPAHYRTLIVSGLITGLRETIELQEVRGLSATYREAV